MTIKTEPVSVDITGNFYPADNPDVPDNSFS
jgi:hypothetical protein